MIDFPASARPCPDHPAPAGTSSTHSLSTNSALDSTSNTSGSPSQASPAAKIDTPHLQALDAASEFLNKLSNYLPIGSLIVDTTRASLPHKQNEWRELCTQDLEYLESQQSIKVLVEKRWIKVFLYMLQGKGRACLRVYVLPDDVGRRYVEKGDRVLRKHLMGLIANLDLSCEAWTGQRMPAVSGTLVNSAKSFRLFENGN